MKKLSTFINESKTKLSVGDEVVYYNTKSGGTKIKMTGEIISISKDKLYAEVRNRIDDIDYKPVKELSLFL